MKLLSLYLVVLASAVLWLTACSEDASNASAVKKTPTQTVDTHDKAQGDDHFGYNDGDDHETHLTMGDERGWSANGDQVEISADEARAAGIRVASAESGMISSQLELPAEIRRDADRVAKVSPQVAGIVAEFYAGEGDSVNKGDRLARLTSRELASLKADFLNALSAERLAETELAREENLWEQRITSEADVQSARAAFSAANAAREAAENRLHAIGIDHGVLDQMDKAEDGALAQAFVTAPIAGEVIQRSVSLGETVAAGGAPMFVILDDSVVWADIAVYKEDLADVQQGQAVTIQREDGGVLAEGNIANVFPVISEVSRTATARVILGNSEQRLKPGQFVTALIETGKRRSVVRVPSRAIVSVENKLSVFVPTEQGFQPREVSTGARFGGYTEIIAGLGAGDAFVSEGAFTLKAELEKDAFGDGHAH